MLLFQEIDELGREDVDLAAPLGLLLGYSLEYLVFVLQNPGEVIQGATKVNIIGI